MLNREYEMLKHIYKHPRVTKSVMLKKFPDFEEYRSIVSEYAFVDDENKDTKAETQEELLQQANQMGFTIGETQEYVKSNMSGTKDVADDSLIFYSAKRILRLYIEEKRRKFWSFALPYGITTLIAIASVIARLFGK